CAAADLTMDITEPLQTFRVTLRGSAQAYDDPAALLRGEAGRPTELTMDLVYGTEGVPYQYRITPRYEIPCTVSGTVTADGRSYQLDSVPGQRDHSWGVRDWWSMEWVWSALHLEDGTRLHGVDVRIPGAPPVGIGYIQQPGEALIELQTVAAREEFGDNGLPLQTTVTLAPGDVTATIEVRGHAPV
ncbi:phosphotransferase, partial [Mycolicibacterium elephantis]